MPTPLRACRPRLTAAQGPRVEQRAIVARTIQKSHGRPKPKRRLDPARTAATDLFRLVATSKVGGVAEYEMLECSAVTNLFD